MACINQDVFADNVRCTSGSQLDIHKAIAYKLDEISKKLDGKTLMEVIDQIPVTQNTEAQ